MKYVKKFLLLGGVLSVVFVLVCAFCGAMIDIFRKPDPVVHPDQISGSLRRERDWSDVEAAS